VTSLHWKELPLQKLSQTHVLLILGAELNGSDQEINNAVIDQTMKTIQERKRHVQKFASDKLQVLMIAKAQSSGMKTNGRPVITFRDIKESWKNIVCPNDEDKETMYNIQFGLFDNDHLWDKRMETEYMDSNNLVYSTRRPIGRGALLVCARVSNLT